MFRTLPLLLALFMAGCTHPPGAFRLTAPLLIPPAAKDAAVIRATVPIPRVPRKTTCPPSPHGLSIERRARVAVTREALLATTPAELFAWTLSLEKQGCLPVNESARLAENIIDAIPLNPTKRSQLLQGRTGLRAFNSLKVVAPVLKDGEILPAKGPLEDIQSIAQGDKPGSLVVELKTIPSVIGYEIDWYDFAPQDNGPGYRIIPRGAEKHVNGEVENFATPAISRFQFGPAARWYELYMMTKVSSNDFDFVVFSAKTPEELRNNIAAFQSDATKFLQTADPATYTVLPHGSGINAFIRVKINGAMVDLPKGSSVRQAITPGALATLKVRKLHDGKLYPVHWDAGSDQILSLQLEGGEELEW